MKALICNLNLGKIEQKIYLVDFETDTILDSQEMNIEALPNLCNMLYENEQINKVIFTGETYIVNKLKAFLNKNLEIEVK